MKSKKKRVEKSKNEVVVRVIAPVSAPTPADLMPEKEGGKYMIPKTWLNEKQVLRMVQRTPAQHIYSRPAKGGGTWQYVTGAYVEKVLNFTFGWNWDFKVIDKGKEGDQVWVQGELTVKDPTSTRSITKTQFGRADIKFKRDSKVMLDYGNDLKSATTDALKKCASLLGIASDIYGKAEFKDIGVTVQEQNTPPEAKIAPPSDLKPKAGQVIGPDGLPTYVCQKCDTVLTDTVADYSKKLYGKPLCAEHQPNKK